jgi:hypothetical protein
VVSVLGIVNRESATSDEHHDFEQTTQPCRRS